MKSRMLGRTGLNVSALALGTVELGLEYGIATPGEFGRPSEVDAIRLVHAAIDAGINLIDTARGYGASETVLGHALRDRRDRVVLATKVDPLRMDGSPNGAALHGTALRDGMLATLETSLRELQTDYVDIWQIHNVNEDLLAQADVLAETFEVARRSGRIRWTGGSFYGAELPQLGLESDLFDVIQVTYSIFDQRLADSVFALAAEQNVGVLARSVLLKGALTERADHLPDRLDALRIRSQEFRRTVEAAGVDLSPAQAAIAFALAQPQISSVLIGVRTVAELRENLRAATVELPADLLEQLHGLRLDDAALLDPGTWGIP